MLSRITTAKRINSIRLHQLIRGSDLSRYHTVSYSMKCAEEGIFAKCAQVVCMYLLNTS